MSAFNTLPGVAAPPRALDALVAGIDWLDALLAIHLGDAHLHLSWVRPEGGVRPAELLTTLRDTYRFAQLASKRLLMAGARRIDAPAPVLWFELPQRVVILRRVHAYVVACIFDAGMPLGMARLVGARLAAALEPALPSGQDATVTLPPFVPLAPPVAMVTPIPALSPSDTDLPPVTLSFGAGLRRRTQPPLHGPEAERASWLLAYLEEHAPEPHVVKVRLALRAGLPLAALDRLDDLGPEALVLLETAVQDILGLDRADLRRLV